ncbi:MAG TPA: VWA domain-containing protein [Luteitalea sp.]|nr:VWA domain-containing protein [Luteitalea sp.]
MRVPAVLTLACLLGAALPSSAPAQIMSGIRNQPGPRDPTTMALDTNVGSDARPTFRLKVTRVEVSALVVDDTGKPVRDLKAGDFEIFDDGRKQQIESVAAYTYHGGAIPLDTVDSPSDPNAAVALVTNAWSSSSRVIALLLDDLHIDARRTERARQAARYLVANLAPSDLLYVGITSDASRSTTGFIRDRRRALEIIDSMGGLRLPDPTLEMRQTPQTFSDALIQGTSTPGLAASEQQRAMRLQDAYEAIGRIAGAVRDVSGRRKSLIFVTEGSSVGGSITSSGGLAGDTRGTMLDAIAAASVADLAVYPLNPAGLDLPGDRMIEGFTRQVDVGSNDGRRGYGGREIAHDDLSNVITQFLQAKNQLRDLAALTGGVSMVDRNDISSAIEQVLRDASDYYVVAYEPDKEVKGTRVRPLEVRVKRPGLRVFTRKGYMPPPADPGSPRLNADLSPTMRGLIGGAVPVDALPMVVQLFAIGEQKGRTRYAVVTETAGGPLIDGLDGDRIELEQAIVTIDANGKTSNATQKRAELKIGPAQARTVGMLGVRSVWCVDLPPGPHQVRVATVHKQTGRGGSMYVDIVAEAGQPLNPAALVSLAQAPKPTVFVDPEAKKLMDAGQAH